MAVTGFKTAGQTALSNYTGQAHPYFSDDQMFIEYLMKYVSEQYQGWWFFTSTARKSFQDNVSNFNGEDAKAPPDDLIKAFSKSADDGAFRVDMYGRELTLKQDIYELETQNGGSSTGANEEGVSAKQAYSMMALARANAGMNNNGIEVFGPPEDMAMYIIAARHAGILVVNEQEVRQSIDQSLIEEAERAFNAFKAPGNSQESPGSSPTVEKVFTNPSNGLLRHKLRSTGESTFQVFDNPVTDSKARQAVSGLEHWIEKAYEPDAELKPDEAEPEKVKTDIYQSLDKLVEIIQAEDLRADDKSAQELKSLGRCYIDLIGTVAKGMENGKEQSLHPEMAKIFATLDFGKYKAAFDDPVPDFGPEFKQDTKSTGQGRNNRDPQNGDPDKAADRTLRIGFEGSAKAIEDKSKGQKRLGPPDEDDPPRLPPPS